MQLVHPILWTATLASLGAGTARAQVFAQNTSDIPSGSPANNSFTENVDFGDVDLDGDWDAVFADGGDLGNDQNRIWINQGGAQLGTLGVFVDRTAVLLPAVADDSHDVELADIDGDLDLDLLISNTSEISNQANRWWVNQGGEQAGSAGAYVDGTAARWVGLGGPGSSVNEALVLPTGGFVTWSGDSDFGDFDNDGDLDLLTSSYGGSFSGITPTRLFLNDGDGFFAEFNPSGFIPAGAALFDGSPALWADGLQMNNTFDTSGLEADVTANGTDVDIGDQDNDFDLDILQGTRGSGVPRFFHNQLEEQSGLLGFKDVSHLVFPPSWGLGADMTDQALGDIDDDGDLDLYGINWGAGLDDRLFRNGSGVFGNTTTLADSGSFESEGDFFDYDNDGDTDLYVANFAGADFVYRNDDPGAGAVVFSQLTSVESGLGSITTQSLDADVADVDGDGDYDVFVAKDNGAANRFWENQTNVPDTTPPHLDALEILIDQSAVTQPSVVRTHVYDNASYYTAWYNETALDVRVEGCRLPDFAMRSSMGQVFRGEVPGNLLGTVEYRARSSDEYGNTGLSITRSYVGSTGASIGGTFGADSGASAPDIRALSVAFPGTTLYVGADGMTPGHLWLLAFNSAGLPGPIPIPGIGIANVAGLNFFTYTGLVDGDGCAVQPIFLPPSVPSVSVYFQMFTFPGGVDLLESSLGLEVEIQP